MRYTAMLLALTCLAGCAQYDAIRTENLEAASRERVAADDAACKSSGLQPGTLQYDDCRRRYANQQARETRGHQRLMEQMLNQNDLRPTGQ
ncbi:MAG TPA: hypothetical protein VN655_02035 [Pseudolabrys sp.]|jgi:hypothetical protein|nr:hypothetical protein [Pseudolabrys sp.]